ncbi:hypothetical protein [uncultured Gammaproteobacteria bacterium]|nr:hypothetical protein [uncultured Gammaproteobacteria bacterium]
MGSNCALKASTFINTLVLSQHEGGECLDDVVHIAKDKALRLVTNQQVPTPQAIGTWLRRLGKDNQGIKALRKANKTLLKATLNNCKNITLGDLCINRNNHQKPTFHPLGDFLNPALALLGQGLKKSPMLATAAVVIVMVRSSMLTLAPSYGLVLLLRLMAVSMMLVIF